MTDHALAAGGPPGPTVVTLSATPRVHDSAIAALEGLGADWHEAPDTDGAIALLHEHAVDVLLVCDAHDGSTSERIRAAWPRLRCGTQLVVVTNRESGSPIGRELPYPWDAGLFNAAIRDAARIARLTDENDALRRRLAARTRRLVESRSTSVHELEADCTRAAESDRDIVLVAEPGTRLENWARLIHETGPRFDAPFARLDGRTLTAEGYELESANGGRIDRARGGTIFVDHADETAEAIRARLRHRAPALRIAGSTDWPEQYVVGWYGAADEEIVVGARVIAIPSLRERREDVPDLAIRFLDDVALRLGEPPKSLDPAALQRLAAHDWPGGETELLGVVENAFRVSADETITESDVAGWLSADEESFDRGGALALRTMERRLIEATFARCNGNRERTAKSLGIGIRTLSGKLREYGYPPRGGPGSNRTRRRDAA